MHVAQFDGQENPLATLRAVAEFQRDLARRCAAAPTPTDATIVGSYSSIG